MKSEEVLFKKIEYFLGNIIKSFAGMINEYPIICVSILWFLLISMTFGIYYVAGIEKALLFLGVVASIATVSIQNKKLRLARIEAEVSALLEGRLELIKKLNVIFVDNVSSSSVQELYDEYSTMVEFLFGRQAIIIFERIAKLHRVTSNLSNALRPLSESQEEKFFNDYDKLIENSNQLYVILYKSIRVSSYI